MALSSEANLACLLPLRNIHVLQKSGLQIIFFFNAEDLLWYGNLLVLNIDPNDQLVFDYIGKHLVLGKLVLTIKQKYYFDVLIFFKEKPPQQPPEPN